MRCAFLHEPSVDERLHILRINQLGEGRAKTFFPCLLINAFSQANVHEEGFFLRITRGEGGRTFYAIPAALHGFQPCFGRADGDSR